MCYRSSLHVMIENKLRTIAMPTIQLFKRGHPGETGLHIALRKIKLFIIKI